MDRSSSASTMTAKMFSPAPRSGSKRIASNAPRFTSSRRILHRDWTLYDTGHAVFQPKHMTPEELEQGYAWIYQRLFSHASIWRRRPQVETWADLQSIPLYLAMSYLYKRSNRFWHLLIKHDLVNPVWKPLVEMTRRRHLHYRRRLAQREMAVGAPGRWCRRECEARSVLS